MGVIRILACIDLGKRLAGVTDIGSARYCLNGPGWRKSPHGCHFSLGVPVVIGSRAMITQMRIMVLLLALLALLGGAALAFVAFEVMRPHPTEQVPPP